jgi:CYTH domain-containing protein
METMEIERKFVVKGLSLSKLEGLIFSQIEQYYLRNCRGVRLRKENDRFTLTIKGEGLQERVEVEKEIMESEFQELLSLCDRGLKKRRYFAGRWEIDVFEGSLEGLILAEIELEYKEEPPPKFPFPEARLVEVTDNPAFLNQNLALGRIPPLKP